MTEINDSKLSEEGEFADAVDFDLAVEAARRPFAEYALVAIDRIARNLEELRHQMRFADETMLAASLGGVENPMRVEIHNAHAQSIGVEVQRDGAVITVTVHHRGVQGMQDISRGQSLQVDV